MLYIEALDDLERFFQLFPPMNKVVIIRKCGLDNLPPRTGVAVAKSLSMSAENVRKKELYMYERLRRLKPDTALDEIVKLTTSVARRSPIPVTPEDIAFELRREVGDAKIIDGLAILCARINGDLIRIGGHRNCDRWRIRP